MNQAWRHKRYDDKVLVRSRTKLITAREAHEGAVRAIGRYLQDILDGELLILEHDWDEAAFDGLDQDNNPVNFRWGLLKIFINTKPDESVVQHYDVNTYGGKADYEAAVDRTEMAPQD